jgi:NADH-quinone oxidoreductase subunit L
VFELAPLILLFPLFGVLINLALGGRLRGAQAGIIGSTATALAFGVAVVQFAALTTQPEGATAHLFTWIELDALRVAWSLRIDTLSVTMMLVVTGVGALIHLYAIGYMHGDERYPRFFVYLNLFILAMLVLVAADNFLMLFVGWEGVGLCSFLLIGFWFDKPDGEGWRNSSAARKAFLVNRVGDFGFLLALMMIGTTFGSFDFAVVLADAPARFAAGDPFMVALTLFLVLGATAKSAQIPLFVWLPDAMAGPTPVSALIHAATMVTAGIYLGARAHVLFALAPVTQEIIVAVGALTALIGASAAVAQHDIKRVLAYSTISQLGFMMAAVGMAAYSAALFHLITHAFFKALLFLCAGSVVHALGHGGDMRLMGGLHRRMPITFTAFVIGALSLAGIPPLAAFFSKDEIIGHAYVSHPAIFLLLVGAAFLTAFYIARQVILIFFGEARSEAAARAVESPRLLTVPLIALATLALIGGVINLPGSEGLAQWLGHTLGEAHTLEFQLAAAAISLVLSVIGALLAYRLYAPRPLPDPLAQRRGYGLLTRGWGLSDLYERVFARAYDRGGAWLARADESAFYGLDTSAANNLRRVSVSVKPLETRQLNWNVAAVLGGLALVLLLTFWIGGR